MIDFNINASSSKGLTQYTYSFMWGQFFYVDEPESIHIYQTSRLDDGFNKFQFKTNFPFSIV